MKKAKRMLAIFMTLAMVLTMTIAMSAVSFADAPADSPLTVTGLAVGDVAHFYKVVEWAPNDTASVAGWKAVAPFDTVLTKEKLTEVLVGTPDDPETSESEYVAPTLITAALAGQLARLVEDVDPEDIISIEVGADKTAVLNLAEGGEGMYMALITPADVDTVYNPVFVSADFTAAGTNSWAVNEEATYSDTAAAKKSTVGLEKTASTSPEDGWDDAEWTTTAIGDTVTFTVNTTIPGYGTVYTNPTFIIRDNLNDLELVEGSVELSAPEDIADDAYEIEESTNGYKITFSKEYLQSLTVPTEVEVKYSAIVTTEASLHVNTEKNEVSTEFSHDPSNESDHGFKKDTTQHYTFTIDANALGSDSTQSGHRTSEIVKVGVKADGTPITDTQTTSEIDPREYVQGPLEGAKFELYTDSGATTKYVPKTADGTPGSPMDIRSDANGRLYVLGGSVEHGIYGLDAGTYYLKEVEAPAGYVADQKAHKIEIAAETNTVNVTEYTTDGVEWISSEEYAEKSEEEKATYKSYTFETEVLSSYSITIDDQPVASYTFTNNGTDADIVWSETGPTEKPFPITNTQGTELPSTGGIGTIIFYTLGTILVVACGIVLISRRRLSRKR